MSKSKPALIVIMLLFFATQAGANPLLWSEADIPVIRQKVLVYFVVILWFESLAVSIIMKAYRFSITRTFLPIFALNLLIYFMFQNYLIVYDKYDFTISIVAEAIVIVAESFGISLISRVRFIRQAAKPLGALDLFFFVVFFNIFSAWAGLECSITVAGSVLKSHW